VNGGDVGEGLVIVGRSGGLSTRGGGNVGWRESKFGAVEVAWSLALLRVRISETNGMGLGLSKRLPLTSLVLSVSRSS